MKKRKLINWLCLSGVVAAVFYLLHDTIGTANYPGYNWASQAVSDLTATDAPSFAVAGGLTTASEFLVVSAARFYVFSHKRTRESISVSGYIYLRL